MPTGSLDNVLLFMLSFIHDDGSMIQYKNTLTIKCIRDDTKAATGPSPHYIKKIKKIQRKTIFNVADGILSPCNVAHGSGMTCH